MGAPAIGRVGAFTLVAGVRGVSGVLVPWIPYVPAGPLPDDNGHDESPTAPERTTKEQRTAARDSRLRFYERVISTKKPYGNKKSSVPFADPVGKLNPHITRQINYRWFACLQGDFILTKRTDRGIADELLESLVVILEPGWNIPTHFFVGCKQ
jgi:hypothetical protein